MVTIAWSAAGQTLELTKSLEPPPLRPSLAASLVSLLEKEAGDLNQAGAGANDDAARTVLSARANVRVLAAELLAAGDRAGAAGSEVALDGLKLAIARDALDSAMQASITHGGDGPDHAALSRAALEALAAFNRGVAEHLQHGGEAHAGGGADAAASDDVWLAPLLSRLVPIVVGPGGKPLLSHWIEPHGPAASRPAATAPASAPDDSLENLRRRASASAALDDAARANLLNIIEFLDRGRQFAELQGQVDRYRRTIEELLDFADALAGATWLGDQPRAAMTTRLGEAIEWFADAGRRQRGMDVAERLHGMARVLDAGSVLVGENVEGKTMRSIVSSLDAAADHATDPREVERLHAQVAMVLERMQAARALPHESGLARELRTIERDVAKAYRDTEAKVLKELAAGAIEHGSTADPGFASLLADHRERFEDLQQVRRMPQWSAAINRIYPPAAKDFDTQMRRRAQGLLEPTRRPQARLALEQFEEQLQDFERLPFEQALKDGTPAALELTGGLQAQILAMVVEKRRAWADEWSRADPSPDAARSMTLLHRLLQCMRDAAALIDLQPEILNRWPAWQVSADIVAGGQSDIVTRLKLACAAAAKGDLNTLTDQLDRIDRESPLAKLAGRLMHMIGNDLRERPAGADGALAQLVYGPSEHAVLLPWRDDLARLCRYASEAEAARAGAAGADAVREIQAYVNALATRLLEQTAKQESAR